MDVFLMIRRHKTTIFTDAKESSTVFELKRIVEGILKRPPDEQRLYKMTLSKLCASSPSPAPRSCLMS
uniref:Elongin B n=1 Tax=Oryctolagus cuniculus TaxID=9986 RepID=A0A5F9D4R7_RABIT